MCGFPGIDIKCPQRKTICESLLIRGGLCPLEDLRVYIDTLKRIILDSSFPQPFCDIDLRGTVPCADAQDRCGFSSFIRANLRDIRSEKFDRVPESKWCKHR